jgi:hypothetical protein
MGECAVVEVSLQLGVELAIGPVLDVLEDEEPEHPVDGGPLGAFEGVPWTITDDGLAQCLVEQRIAQNLVDAGKVLVVDVDLVAEETAEGEGLLRIEGDDHGEAPGYV